MVTTIITPGATRTATHRARRRPVRDITLFILELIAEQATPTHRGYRR